MDDFYIIVRSKTHAKDFLEYINTFVQSLNIELNEKSQIIPFKNGIRFCGFHTYITSSGIPIYEQQVLEEIINPIEKKLEVIEKI